MKTKHTLRSLLIALLSSLAIFTAQMPVAACTRALYVAKDGTVHWASPSLTNLGFHPPSGAP
jgi:hypothetical protein